MTLIHCRLICVSLAASFLLTLSSCGTVYQAHHDMSLNLLEKGDIKATGSINKVNKVSEQPFFTGLVAYSPIKHLGVLAKHFNYKAFRSGNFNPSSEDQDNAEGSFTELAIGGYYGLKFKNKNNEIYEDLKFMMPIRLTGDLYLGASRGNLNFRYGRANEQLNFNRMFAHFGLHFQAKILKISYAFKLISLDYHKIVLNGNIPYASYLDVQQLIVNEPLIYNSSSLRMEFGMRHAQFYIDINFSNLPDYMNTLYFEEKLASVGVTFDINEFWKKNTIPKK